MGTSRPASDWKDGFLFVGNHLLLDFINTRPVQDGRATELLQGIGDVLRWFVAAELLTCSEAENLQRKWKRIPQAAALPHTLQHWREMLRKSVSEWQRTARLSDAALDEINRKLALLPMRTGLRKKSGGGIGAVTYFAPECPEDLFAPLAQSAADFFVSTDRTRVRQCDNCVLLFLDTSKKGTRHWCSMRLCGNRAKVAAYAERKRGEMQ
jgi:predicted RNA-binding Zn ribbon-like protein